MGFLARTVAQLFGSAAAGISVGVIAGSPLTAGIVTALVSIALAPWAMSAPNKDSSHDI